MTLIRTESGVMVEPRLKDVVEAFWTRCTIEMIGSTRLKLKPIDADFDLMVVNPDECELLHRPFAIGDLVNVNQVGDFAVFTIEQFYTDMLKSESVRHADHALRDHSEYKP
jgi:hypothetical protein